MRVQEILKDVHNMKAASQFQPVQTEYSGFEGGQGGPGGPGLSGGGLGGFQENGGHSGQKNTKKLEKQDEGPGVQRCLGGVQGVAGGVQDRSRQVLVQSLGGKMAKNRKKRSGTVWLAYYAATCRILCRRFQYAKYLRVPLSVPAVAHPPPISRQHATQRSADFW